ncbi:MAG: P-loop NTPase fold protein, partial [Rikenellaceae bacterium]
MRAKFIPDREVVLDKDNDLLKTKVYADSLKDIINNSPQNEVFTIGLFGGWGTGKSSIIKTAQQEIEAENDKVKFITYDSWKYANDSFRRMFLLQIQEDLNLEQAPAMSRFYKSTNTEAKPTEKINIKGVVYVFFVCLIMIFLVGILPFDTSLKIPIIGVLSLLSILLGIRNTIIHTLKISISEPMLFAPEQFEDCFKQMVSKALKQENCLMKIYRKGVEFVRSKDNVPANNLEKIVIVIDNIDRCHNSMAYQLLTDVKTFLSDEKYNIVFVTPVDDGALRKYLFSGSNISDETCNKDKEEFLRKFFNITLRIKPHQPTEMHEFVHLLNKKYELSLKSGTISLLAKEFAKNPRRIIQLLNNLNVELRQYSEEFSKTNESVICAILILKEEYFDFYTKVIDNVSLLRSGYTKVLDADKKENNNKDSNKEVLSFMRLADSYFGKSTNRDLIKILTNSDNA